MDSITEIKQKLDVVDVVGSYVSLKKSGKNYKGLCPFHGEKTPSFMVSPELQIYKCFGCNESGDIFSFVQKIEGVDFGDALERLAEKAGVKLEKANYDPNSQLKKQLYFINSIAARFYNKVLLNSPAGAKGLDYLKNKRGLTDLTIANFNLGYAPDNWDTLYKFLKTRNFTDEDLLASGVVIITADNRKIIDKFRGRVMFPFTEIDGKVVGFTGRSIHDREPKYLNTGESIVFYKSSFLYGLDKARVSIKTQGAVFVEGQMDVISSHQAGITNTIASSGTSLTELQLKTLARYTKDIIFCFDTDSAGVAAIYRAIELADKQDFNIKVAVLPEEVKDLDELIKSDPKAENAKRFIEEAVSVYDFYLYTALKKYDKKTALGKKRIMEDLTARFSKVSNPVVLDHYIKQISEELGISIEITLAVMRNTKNTDEVFGSTTEQAETDTYSSARQSDEISTELYFLILLFKLEPEVAEEFLSSVDISDFTNVDVKRLLTVYRDFVKTVKKSKKRFNAKKFVTEIEKTAGPDSSLGQLFMNLYMKDLESLSNDTMALTKELNTVISRVKSDSTKRQLSDLSEKIKQAEAENSTTQLKKLTLQFNELSKKLVK